MAEKVTYDYVPAPILYQDNGHDPSFKKIQSILPEMDIKKSFIFICLFTVLCNIIIIKR